MEISPLVREFDHYAWMGQVLDHFARAEQALGNFSKALDLPIQNGSLGSLQTVRQKLAGVPDKKAKNLLDRIEAWLANRPYRHLLAHATLVTVFDARGAIMLVTRHLPRDAQDVTPDRVWTHEDQMKLLREATNDSRSICDHVKAIMANDTLMAKLKAL